MRKAKLIFAYSFSALVLVDVLIIASSFEARTLSNCARFLIGL